MTDTIEKSSTGVTNGGASFWRRLSFFSYITLIGFIANNLSVDMPGVAPFLLGNMAIFLIGNRLGWRWGSATALLCLLPVSWLPFWPIVLAELALIGYFEKVRRFGIAWAYTYTWLLLSLPSMSLFAYAFEFPLLSSLLHVLVLATTSALNLYGSKMIEFVSANAKIKHHQSLSEQLSSRVAVFAATPFSLAISGVLYIFVMQDLGMRHQQLTEHQKNIGLRLEEKRSEYLSALNLAASQLREKNETSSLTALLEQQQEFISALISDRNGRIIIQQLKGSLPSTSNNSVADRSYFLEPQKTKAPYLSEVFIGRGLGEDLLFAASAPVFDERLNFDGVVEVSIAVEKLTRNWLIDIPGGLEIIVTDQAQNNVWSTTRHPLGQRVDLQSIGMHKAEKVNVDRLFNQSYDILLNPHNSTLMQITTLESFGWTTYLTKDIASVLYAYNIYTLLAALLTLGTILMIEVNAKAFARRYTIPLRALLHEVKQFELDEQADYQPIRVRGGAVELQELIDDFNIMIRRITNVREQLVLVAAEKSKLNRELENRVIQRTMEIERQKNSIEKLAQVKDRFLATVSHELRTPLAVIIGYTEQLLHAGGSNEKQAKALSTILRNAQFQLELVNDILDSAKLESGKMQLERISVQWQFLLEDALESLAPRAMEKSLSLKLDIRWPIPEWIVIDPTRLRQILLNLLSNAIKFTERGTVTLMVATPKSSRILISVTDTGIGISEAQQVELFAPFRQSDISTTRKYGGSGLGLSICKQLTELMGGTIRVQSKQGFGSTFTVDLPLDVAEPGNWLYTLASRTTAEQSLDDATLVPRLTGHVLIAEDIPELRELIEAMITATGTNLTTAKNGKDAVELCFDKAFDLIFLDLNMPVMDGVQAATLIRNSHPNVPIVALSADVLAESREKLTQFGFTDCLPKPIEKKRLYEAMKRHLQELPSEVRKQPDLPDALRPLRIKYVNRLQSDRLSLESAVKSADWQSVQQILHQTKGAAGSFGFTQLTALAAAAEKLVRAKDFDSFYPVMHKVLLEITHLTLISAEQKNGNG